MASKSSRVKSLEILRCMSSTPAPFVPPISSDPWRRWPHARRNSALFSAHLTLDTFLCCPSGSLPGLQTTTEYLGVNLIKHFGRRVGLPPGKGEGSLREGKREKALKEALKPSTGWRLANLPPYELHRAKVTWIQQSAESQT